MGQQNKSPGTEPNKANSESSSITNPQGQTSEASSKAKKPSKKLTPRALPKPERPKKSLQDGNFSNFYKPECETIKPKRLKNKVDRSVASDVFTRISNIYGLSGQNTVTAICTLIRMGAANAKAPKSMAVEVDVGQPRPIEITKQMAVLVLNEVAGHKDFRAFADFIAPTIIEGGINSLKQQPELASKLRGDLANRIDRKLAVSGKAPLTALEAICCATYAQNLKDLDSWAQSNRLKNLLVEDLLARKKLPSKAKNKDQKDANANSKPKGKNIKADTWPRKNGK